MKDRDEHLRARVQHTDAVTCKTCRGTSVFLQADAEAKVERGEAVDHPAHYAGGGVEVIDAIEAWELGFNLGNAVKYIARAGRKDPTKTREDLEKAAWYLARAIRALGCVDRPTPKGDNDAR